MCERTVYVMRRSFGIATPLVVAALGLGLAACSNFEPTTPPGAASGQEEAGAAAEGGHGEGLPALFSMSACDMIPAADLDTAGFTPEPADTIGEAEHATGNGCWWKGSGGRKTVSVALLLSDLDFAQFAQVDTQDDTTVEGYPALHVTGRDDLLIEMDDIPVCATRIEVQQGVILEFAVGVSNTEDYSTDDAARLAEACALHDELLPKVTASIPE